MKTIHSLLPTLLALLPLLPLITSREVTTSGPFQDDPSTSHNPFGPTTSGARATGTRSPGVPIVNHMAAPSGYGEEDEGDIVGVEEASTTTDSSTRSDSLSLSTGITSSSTCSVIQTDNTSTSTSLTRDVADYEESGITSEDISAITSTISGINAVQTSLASGQTTSDLPSTVETHPALEGINAAAYQSSLQTLTPTPTLTITRSHFTTLTSTLPGGSSTLLSFAPTQGAGGYTSAFTVLDGNTLYQVANGKSGQTGSCRAPSATAQAQVNGPVGQWLMVVPKGYAS
ncbi:hypothetical protein I302_106135 [Kwoniella bestiolae CBS 10118]|uniref:Uncharacterized protein n=1 Tax=Kwoniella bestiolae CBS 10118 TaxID=1296100 RepID=A0A1B9G350_9TREE|nr:hypothetical protein I302_05258 [Kwoniella bestiolae CBS 10118]OCF25438.1 hypothetical protein I302_05258 [Kwoniella bestiolae CBS 10118]